MINAGAAGCQPAQWVAGDGSCVLGRGGELWQLVSGTLAAPACGATGSWTKAEGLLCTRLWVYIVMEIGRGREGI